MDGLDLLGAADAFAGQYITFRIKSIDRDKLAAAVGGAKGSIASGALAIVEQSPRAILDVVSPVIKQQAQKYGVDADIIISSVPGGPRPISEFWPGIIAGTVLGLMSLGIYKMVKR